MNNDILVSHEVIHQLLLQMTQSGVEFCGESLSEWPKISIYGKLYIILYIMNALLYITQHICGLIHVKHKNPHTWAMQVRAIQVILMR